MSERSLTTGQHSLVRGYRRQVFPSRLDAASHLALVVARWDWEEAENLLHCCEASQSEVYHVRSPDGRCYVLKTAPGAAETVVLSGFAPSWAFLRG